MQKENSNENEKATTIKHNESVKTEINVRIKIPVCRSNAKFIAILKKKKKNTIKCLRWMWWERMFVGKKKTGLSKK